MLKVNNNYLIYILTFYGTNGQIRHKVLFILYKKMHVLTLYLLYAHLHEI